MAQWSPPLARQVQQFQGAAVFAPGPGIDLSRLGPATHEAPRGPALDTALGAPMTSAPSPHVFAPGPHASVQGVGSAARGAPLGLGPRPGTGVASSLADPAHAGDLAAAVREQTSVLASLARRPGAARDPLSGDGFDDGESDMHLPGARGAAALEGCRAEYTNHSDRVTRGVVQRLVQMGARVPGAPLNPRPSMRSYFQHEVGFGTYRTLGYTGWGLATRFDLLLEQDVSRCQALLGLLCIGIEQVTLDGGKWPMAWLLTMQPEPPWAAMSRQPVADPLRPFSRLADPRWTTACAAYIRDVDRLGQIRKIDLGGKGRGKGKGKDPPKGEGSQ